jgi:hypothetical protein
MITTALKQWQRVQRCGSVGGAALIFSLEAERG